MTIIARIKELRVKSFLKVFLPSFVSFIVISVQSLGAFAEGVSYEAPNLFTDAMFQELYSQITGLLPGAVGFAFAILGIMKVISIIFGLIKRA